MKRTDARQAVLSGVGGCGGSAVDDNDVVGYGPALGRQGAQAMLLRRYHEWIREAVEDLELSARHRVSAAQQLKILEGAQRFVLSDTASLACQQLAEHPEALRKARGQIFAPFPKTWVEFPSDRGPVALLWIADDAEGRSGGIVFIQWYTFSPRPLLIPARVNLDAEKPVSVPAEMPDLLRKAPDYVRSAFPTLVELNAAVPEIFNWTLAAWALLASKGMTGRVEADMGKLNARRAKRGLYPLLAYSEIRLNLDAERAVRCKTAVATGTMPLHPVRAHLRLLPTGRVAIVSAHMRGNPEYGVRSHHYTLTTADDVKDARRRGA